MKKEWLLYTGMFLAASLSPLGSTMIAVALPSIGHELSVSSSALTQWLVSSYLIVGIAVMSPGGKLGDLFGHRKALTIGMTIYGIGSAAGCVFASLPSLAIARISMAAGGAMTVPATMALLRNIVPEARRPRTFGYFGAVMGTAAAIGPLVGGELVSRFGWRAVFVANIPVILLAFAMLHFAGLAAVEPAAAARKIPRFDIEGSVLLGVALTLIVVASRAHGSTALASGVIGVVLLLIFGLWEQRAVEPVMNLGLFRIRSFTAANLVIGLQNLAMYALLFQLPIFFEQVRGLPAGVTGRSIIGMMLAMVVFAPVGGRLAERIGTRFTVFAGTLSSLAGVLLLGNFTGLLVPSDALPGLVLMGTGLGLSSAPSQAAAMSSVSRHVAGMAGGAISTARYVGGIIGITVLGQLLASNSGVASHSTAASVYGIALLIAAISALALPGKSL